MASCGGYDVEFLEKLDKDLECPICLLALKRPLQTTCGHLMCHSCVDRITTNDQMIRCPLDGIVSARNEVFLDRIHERKVLSLKVRCSRSSSGCSWIGELRHLENHTTDSGDCIFSDVTCPFSNVGCPDKIMRKGLPDHLQSQSQRHTLLLLKTVEQLKDDSKHLQHSCEALKADNEALKRENADLKRQLERITAASFEFLWQIDSWSQKLQDAKDGGNNDLYSDPFYTGHPGYHLSLNLCPNGDNKSGHMSLYVVVMHGHYDRLLVWPFACKCTLIIVDQQNGGKNWSRTLDPIKQGSRAGFEMPTSSQNDGTGWTRFINHRDLYSRSYIEDDSLLIKAEIHFQ